MKILITGSSGFIGSNLKSYYPKAILPNRGEVITFIKYHKPDIIFHLAGNPLVKTSNAQSLYEANCQLTLDIIKNSKSGCHIIYASSATVYGDSKALLYEHSETNPTSLYGVTKLISEQTLELFSMSGKIRSTILRFVANVGPNSTHGVLKDLLHKYNNNNILDVIGDRPGSVKPYCHVEDTCRAMKYVQENFLYGTYNVSTNNNISVEGLTNIIEENLKKNKAVNWLGESANWKGDNKYLAVSSAKLISHGFQYKYPTSEEAINAAIKKF